MRLLLILLCISCSASASNIDNALAVFNAQFVEKPQGIYSHKNITFLVARKQCIKTKKFAGTKEQKAATATIMALFGRYAAQQSLALTLDDVPYTGSLQQVIFEQIMRGISQQSQQHQSSSQKIVDRDTGQCERLVVYALPSIEKSIRDDALITTEVSKAITSVLDMMIKQKNEKQLTDWASQLEFSEFSRAINKTVRDENNGELSAAISPTFDSSKLYNQVVDTDLVVYNVLKNTPLKTTKAIPAEYQAFALSLTQSAERLFNKGEDSKLIFRQLSLSLNINSNQPKAWYLLGSLYRAFDNPVFSMHCQYQAIRQDPWFIDSWIELAKSKKLLTPDVQLGQFYRHLNQLSTGVMSPWAAEQIKQSL